MGNIPLVINSDETRGSSPLQCEVVGSPVLGLGGDAFGTVILPTSLPQ